MGSCELLNRCQNVVRPRAYVWCSLQMPSSLTIAAGFSCPTSALAWDALQHQATPNMMSKARRMLSLPLQVSTTLDMFDELLQLHAQVASSSQALSGECVTAIESGVISPPM